MQKTKLASLHSLSPRYIFLKNSLLAKLFPFFAHVVGFSVWILGVISQVYLICRGKAKLNYIAYVQPVPWSHMWIGARRTPSSNSETNLEFHDIKWCVKQHIAELWAFSSSWGIFCYSLPFVRLMQLKSLFKKTWQRNSIFFSFPALKLVAFFLTVKDYMTTRRRVP